MIDDPADDADFPFTNRTGRPTGPVLRALSSVLPGVAAVQRQVAPYAEAWREANRTALRGPHPRWVALGDSMTQGIGASAPLTGGWVGQLVRQLPAPVDIINLSQSGARVEDVIAQQLPAWRTLPSAPAGEILTVLIGSNDAISPVHRRLLAEAVGELLTLLPEHAIISTIPSPVASAREASALILAAADAGRVRAVVPDPVDASAWRGKLAADRFHPNDTGYAMIAATFAPAVAGALSSLSVTGP